MAKNIMVLAMSTLPLVKKIEDDKEIVTIAENNFAWKEDDVDAKDYYSQLEPASRMIREREGSLDKIIILATPATKELKKFEYGSSSLEISAVDFYLERMKTTETDIPFNPEVEVIDLDENEIVEAISQTVDSIRNYWLENIKDEPKLWIDTQGGFRDISLMINAVISLLKGDIKPSGIYAVKFSGGKNSVKHIEDKTNTYKIFDFVSGVNEFSRYGRAEQLEDYYKSVEDDEGIPEAVKIMSKIGDSIQMCDMEAFDNNLQELRNLKSNKEKGLLGIFWNQIKNDYGNLLEDSWTGIDVVEWFYKKKLYQQALTYIESKLPLEWVKDKKILQYLDEDEDLLYSIQEKLNKTYEDETNTFINQIAFGCFDWHKIMSENKKGICCKKDDFEDTENLKEGRKKDFKDFDDKEEIKILPQVKGEIPDCELHVVFSDTVDKNQVMDMVLLYHLLKAERNNFNHMANSSKKDSEETKEYRTIIWRRVNQKDGDQKKTNNKKSNKKNSKPKSSNCRADQKTLSNVIGLFIKTSKNVYQSIKK